MGLRLSRRNQLLADLHRERQIGQPTPVQVPELTVANPELDTAKPMRLDRDAGPTRDLPLDRRGNLVAHLEQYDAKQAPGSARRASVQGAMQY